MLAATVAPVTEVAASVISLIAPSLATSAFAATGGAAQALAQTLAIVGLVGASSPKMLSKHRPLAVSDPDGQPGPTAQTPGSGSGGSVASGGGSGFFFFALAELSALIALSVPRLSCRLPLIKELDTPAPFVLLLDRPG